MKASEFRKLIREEVRKVLKEIEEPIAPYYYMQFNGTVQPMGPTSEDPTGRDRSDRVSRGPLNKPADILNVRRFPKNSWKEMDIYKTMINSKPGYVLISADNRNKWAIIQTDAKFNASVTAAATVDDKQERDNRYRYAYKMAFDAVTGYTNGNKKDPKITPQEFLGGALKEAATIDSTPLGDPKVKDALKKLLNARKRNSEDETAHDQMEQYLIQLFTKMKLQDPESFASYMMEDEEFATGTVDGMISSIEFALEDEEAM